ncbi:YceK/YidQ family lipoprotein [Escherichia coli]
MRLIVVNIMVTLLSGCGSIISRTIPGQGHGNQNIYPGVQWTCVSAWRLYVTILGFAISLWSSPVLLTAALIDTHHGSV